MLYLFARRPRYFFDLHAVSEPHTSRPYKMRQRDDHGHQRWRGTHGASVAGLGRLKAIGRVGHPLDKNPGDVWRMSAGNLPRSGHHAVFPLPLSLRAIAAGCPEACCLRCGRPAQRQAKVVKDGSTTLGAPQMQCDCGAPTRPGLVLDPLMDAGTTAVAAEALRRHWLGIELNPHYVSLAMQRARASPRSAAGCAAGSVAVRGPVVWRASSRRLPITYLSLPTTNLQRWGRMTDIRPNTTG